MSGALLDVNVLLSLAWPNHQFHSAAVKWYERHRSKGWWTCATTELGFIRLSCNSAFSPNPRTPPEAIGLLTAITADAHHSYLAETRSPGSLIAAGKLTGHKQITDSYLVALAAENKLKFATFDARMRGLASASTMDLIVP